MASRRSGAAWGSVLAGLASVATLPVAIYVTRFSGEYELLHAGFAIPLAAALGFVALVLAGRSRTRGALALSAARAPALARAGRVLGIVGLCMAAAAVVSLCVYGLLEYAGSRD
ncbi:MAG TPA: hypothetical protein VJ745_04305 [Gaiellaceae bacterium]|nr:hypothetical protein [Gaiellaceae bacterium]